MAFATGELRRQTTGSKGGIWPATWQPRARCPCRHGFAADGNGPAGRTPYGRSVNPRGIVLDGGSTRTSSAGSVGVGGVRVEARLTGRPTAWESIAHRDRRDDARLHDQYHHVIEEVESATIARAAYHVPAVRGDMVFFETRTVARCFELLDLVVRVASRTTDYQYPICGSWRRPGRFLDLTAFPDPGACTDVIEGLSTQCTDFPARRDGYRATCG